MLKKLSITELNRRALIESIKNDELDFAMSSWTQCIAGHCHRVMSARRDEPFGTEDKTPADGILKILSLLVPRDIVLQGLSLEDHRLILTGTVTAGEDVAETVLIEFMQKLEESSFFIEATLLASRKTASAQEFEIKCDLIH